MARRNRTQELKKYGALQDGYKAPEALKVPVTDEDRRLFGGLAMWSLAYVNFVYQHGGHDNKPQPKRFSEPVYWRYGWEQGMSVSAGERSLVYPHSADTAAFEEYRRQIRQGIRLEINTEDRVNASHRNTHESLRLDIDADGVVLGGRYYWMADDDKVRPAPDADFTDIDSAHEKTVSGRAAHLLGRFRDLVLEAPSDLRIDGLWGLRSLPPIPSELVPIPEFLN